MRCLEKRPADRWQIGRRAAGPARAARHAERRDDADHDSANRSGRRSASRSPWRMWLPAAVVLLALAAALAFVLTRTAPRGPAGPTGAAHARSGPRDRSGALARRGARRVRRGPLGQTRLYVRQVDGGDPGGDHARARRLRAGAPVVAGWAAAALPLGPRPRGDSRPGRPVEARSGCPTRVRGATAPGRRTGARSRMPSATRSTSGAWRAARLGLGPAPRGPFLHLVARRALDRLRLGQPAVRDQRGVRQHRREQRVGDPRGRRHTGQGYRRPVAQHQPGLALPAGPRCSTSPTATVVGTSTR